MSLKIYLVQWDKEATISRSARLASQGWAVLSESRDGEEAYQKIRTVKPDLLVFDLADKPSHSLQVAEALRKCKSLDRLPIIFVDGDARSLHSARERILNAEFTTSEDLIKSIKRQSSKPQPCLA
jgi:DNA-binding response OmpR family regulator